MDVTPNLTGMTDEEAAVEARRILADFATSFRDESPVPAIGNTPPVAQPGRPPMSQKATDTSTVILAVGAASVPVLGGTALVLHALAQVDPAQLAIGATAPVALLIAVGATLRKLAGVRTTHHHHYDGATVTQDHRSTKSTTVGMVARTNNRQK
ncbi:hypothetical protein [Streptomyces sp. MJP52]|uniref:hypothetical protein n=1 Tax=Streptomyces sp. MJP52 TaxID=2940555 RepID=UPI0024739128|nr:hypothetical protein [Streptomyces sp. MJP52]MDH6224342.1 hypothetical protein [Streptomyces sp. MJP52]